MGRLLEALQAETGTRPSAIPAIPAIPTPQNSRIAGIAAPPATKTPDSVPHETGLRARCKIACEGLPIEPAELYAAMSEADRGAQLSGEEGPEVFAFAESLAERKAHEAEPLAPAIQAAYAHLKRELAAHPDIKRAVEVVDADADPVLLAVGVRGAGFVCMKTPREQYDGFRLLTLVYRWNHEVCPK